MNLQMKKFLKNRDENEAMFSRNFQNYVKEVLKGSVGKICKNTSKTE